MQLNASLLGSLVLCTILLHPSRPQSSRTHNMQCQGDAIPLLTCCSAPRPISSTPAAWQPGRRAASRSASSSLPGTAGIAPRGHCSSPATAGCAAVRKALDTTTGTPLPQVRAQQPLLSSHVPPFLLHSHLGCPSPGKAQEGSSRRPLHPSDVLELSFKVRQPCNSSAASGPAETQMVQECPTKPRVGCWTHHAQGGPLAFRAGNQLGQ